MFVSSVCAFYIAAMQRTSPALSDLLVEVVVGQDVEITAGVLAHLCLHIRGRNATLPTTQGAQTVMLTLRGRYRERRSAAITALIRARAGPVSPRFKRQHSYMFPTGPLLQERHSHDNIR